MPTKVTLRPAADADIPAMVSVFNSAFAENIFNKRCFPTSDPRSDADRAEWILKNMRDPTSHMVIATVSDTTNTNSSDYDHAPIAGWARWVRKAAVDDVEARPPPLVFTPDMYPPSGDPVFAARFFQVNYDATHRITDEESTWFLSTIVVASDCQRKGVGSELMRFGVDKADDEGWAGYLNATMEGKRMYERFGFRDVEVSEFGDGVKSYHMRRPKR